jgi:sortase A
MRREMHSRYRRYRRSRYRARRLFASGVLVLIVLAGLGGLSLISPGPSLEAQKKESVNSVQSPESAGMPEMVAKVEKKEKDKEQAEAKKKEKQKKQAEKKDTEPAPPNNIMSLTVPKLGLYNNVVRNSNSTWALDQGAAKMPGTGFPWGDGDTNTYISGHRWGYPGTESYYQFYNLPSMVAGDVIYLTDSSGRTFEYRVTKKLEVHESETWVTNPVEGKDVVSLQTCLYPPDWTYRLVVRAERVN